MILSRDELADMFGVTERTITNWGPPVLDRRGPRGAKRYDSAEVIRWYVAREGVESDKGRLDRVRADEIEVRLAEKRRELIPAGEVEEVGIAVLSEVRARMLALPTRLAPLVLPLESMTAIQDAIEQGVHDALSSLADDSFGIGFGDTAAAEADDQRVG